MRNILVSFVASVLTCIVIMHFGSALNASPPTPDKVAVPWATTVGNLYSFGPAKVGDYYRLGPNLAVLVNVVYDDRLRVTVFGPSAQGNQLPGYVTRVRFISGLPDMLCADKECFAPTGNY